MKKLQAIVLLLIGLILSSIHFAEAQQPSKIYKVGRLTGGSSGDPFYKESFEAFRQGLRELGWTEGQNIVFETRWTGEKPGSLRQLAAELANLPVDVLVANGATMVEAAKRQRLLSQSSWRQVELIRWRRDSWQAWLGLAETLPD